MSIPFMQNHSKILRAVGKKISDEFIPNQPGFLKIRVFICLYIQAFICKFYIQFVKYLLCTFCKPKTLQALKMCPCMQGGHKDTLIIIHTVSMVIKCSYNQKSHLTKPKKVSWRYYYYMQKKKKKKTRDGKIRSCQSEGHTGNKQRYNKQHSELKIL